MSRRHRDHLVADVCFDSEASWLRCLCGVLLQERGPEDVAAAFRAHRSACGLSSRNTHMLGMGWNSRSMTVVP